jgi:hypothetical protein
MEPAGSTSKVFEITPVSSGPDVNNVANLMKKIPFILPLILLDEPEPEPEVIVNSISLARTKLTIIS